MASRIVSSATVKAVKGRRPLQSRAALVLVCKEKFTIFAYNVTESNLTLCFWSGDLGAFIFQTPAAVTKIKEILAQKVDSVCVLNNFLWMRQVWLGIRYILHYNFIPCFKYKRLQIFQLILTSAWHHWNMYRQKYIYI